MKALTNRLFSTIAALVVALALGLSGLGLVTPAVAQADTVAAGSVDTETITTPVVKKSIAKAKVTLKKSYAYAAKALKPRPVVKVGNTKLVQGTDFKVAYKKNTKVGTAKVTITGLGNYFGTKTATFKIVKANAKKLKISVAPVFPASSFYVSSGSHVTLVLAETVKPKPTVTLGGVKLKKNVDYTVAYKNNKKYGTASVVIKGKGGVKGTKTAKFKVVKSTKHKHNWIAKKKTVTRNGVKTQEIVNYKCKTCWTVVKCPHTKLVWVEFEGRGWWQVCTNCDWIRPRLFGAGALKPGK